MGEAREIMDRVTQAIFSKDMKAAAKLYASDGRDDIGQPSCGVHERTPCRSGSVP